MKVNPIVLLYLLFLCSSVQAQTSLLDTVPLGLSEASWKKVNEIWIKKCPLVSILTTDSTVHTGQILAVNDTALLFYEDNDFFAPSTKDSLLHIYYDVEILAIYYVKERRKLSSNTKSTLGGGVIGAAVGTGLHYLIPDNVFHPVFVILSAGAGGVVGLGLGKGARRRVVFDTTFIVEQCELKDSLPSGESELIWSTYSYTVLQDELPDSASWTSDGVSFDSSLTFDELAACSKRITRQFPVDRVYFTVSGKSTITANNRTPETSDLLMVNAGYRFMKKWTLDFYFSKNTSVVPLHPALGNSGSMKGNYSALSFSYLLLAPDRILTKRLQCSAGLGVAYGSVSIEGFRPGYSISNSELLGVIAKLDFAAFLTRRFAVVMDVQHVFLQSINLPSYEWNQSQGTITIPEQIIVPSFFRIGLGVRLHL